MKEKGQILVFSPLYPPSVGGLQNHAEQWNEKMSMKGYDITVWTPNIRKQASWDEVQPPNVHILRYPAIEVIGNYPIPAFWSPRLYRQLSVLNKQSFHVVVSRTRFFFSSFVALLYAKIRKIPLLHIEHGSDYVHFENSFLKSLAKIYDESIGALVLTQAHTVVANSKATAAFVKTLSGRVADAVIYRGVDTKSIEAIQPVSTPTLPTITYVGRLIEGKGIHDLIRALQDMQDQAWQTWIIGDGPARADLEQQVQTANLANRIHFFGDKDWRDAISHTKASTIVVNPSYAEGLPTSIIEAALCRRAIVATPVGGTKEITTDTVSAFHVTPGNHKQLRQALTTLLANPDKQQQMGQEAYNQVHAMFSWDTAADRYDRILTDICQP